MANPLNRDFHCSDTTDVQRVCGVLHGNEATIWCWFAEGSRALGCQVSLDSDPTVYEIKRNSSTAEVAAGKVQVLVQVSTEAVSYTLLHAWDIGRDGSIGDVRIAGNLSTNVTFCGPSR